MAEKLLLHIEYESEIRNNRIPWDNVAHRLSKSLMTCLANSDNADILKALAHLVPPSRNTLRACAESSSPRATWCPLLLKNPMVRRKRVLPSVATSGCTLTRKLPCLADICRYESRLIDSSITNLVARKVGWTEPVDDLTKPIGNAVYALQYNENEDNHGEDEIYEDDRDDDENDNGGSSRFAGAGSSSHDLDSTRLARAGNRVSHVKNQEDTFAEDSDSGTEGDDESEVSLF